MRVAIDGRWMQQGRRGGVGRGIEGVLPHLSRAAEVHLLVDDRGPKVDVPGRVQQHVIPSGWSHSAALWLQVQAPWWLRGFRGVFHCPFYGLPYVQPVPMVVTMHDLTFERRPEWFRPSRRAVFRAQGRHAARTARRIIAVSDHEAAVISEVYSVARERIIVARNAVEPVFLKAAVLDAEPLLARLGVRQPYVVAFGGAKRRNLPVAIGATEELRRRGHPLSLVVIGSSPRAAAWITSCQTLDDQQLALVLAGSVACCYPTEYEGFGLPALEAVASGAPVVAAQVGALPETLGGIAEWCESSTLADITVGLERLVTDAPRAADLRNRGRAHARTWPTWEDAARSLQRAYEEADA